MNKVLNEESLERNILNSSTGYNFRLYTSEISKKLGGEISPPLALYGEKKPGGKIRSSNRVREHKNSAHPF